MDENKDLSYLFTKKGIKKIHREILKNNFLMGLIYLKIREKYPKDFKLLKVKVDEKEIKSLRWKFPILYLKNRSLKAFKVKNSKKPSIEDFEFRKL